MVDLEKGGMRILEERLRCRGAGVWLRSERSSMSGIFHIEPLQYCTTFSATHRVSHFNHDRYPGMSTSPFAALPHRRSYCGNIR